MTCAAKSPDDDCTEHRAINESTCREPPAVNAESRLWAGAFPREVRTSNHLVHRRHAMKPTVLLATLTMGIATLLTIAPARAQSVDPCAVYTCMAGMSGDGATGGAACTPATTFFFSLAVFDPNFDAAATSQLRQQYLMTCPGANTGTNATILNAIIAEWGTVP
jgi:hypothetical protein